MLRHSGSNLVERLRGNLPDDFSDHQTSGFPQNDFGIPEEELRTQIEALKAAKVPEEKVMKVIDLHEDITDKEEAKEFAKTIFNENNPHREA